MTFKKFAPVNGGSTKADEVELLYGMADLCQTGSYLSSLFTRELVQWVEAKIKNDFSPDVMAEWGYTRQLEAAAQDATRKAQEWADALNESAKKARDQYAAELETMKARHAAELAEAKARETRLIEQINAALADNTSKGSVIHDQGVTIDRMNQRIIELKAELYDLISK